MEEAQLMFWTELDYNTKEKRLYLPSTWMKQRFPIPTLEYLNWIRKVDPTNYEYITMSYLIRWFGAGPFLQ
ncbi:hypothetical protein CS542_04395 [Pedobacter sp. IW39]|nr:hypothetical protein CS542_04395 [Pedobacter sp. IW39]